jgi:hypothetical protein
MFRARRRRTLVTVISRNGLVVAASVLGGSMTMRIRVRAGAPCVAVSLALWVACTPTSAAKKPITGKLSKPGYDVVALAASGEAKTVRAKHGKFKLKPPANHVTLQLRARDGTYAGPIVVGKKKRGLRAILGVKAGAKLGKLKVKARKGYAKARTELAQRFVDAKRKARAKNGIPIGAGKFGRVVSKHTRPGAPGDRDLDGIPDTIDIDDDGDLILDDIDRSSGARASQTSNEIGVSSSLGLDLSETVNANAAAVSDGDVNDRLRRFGGVGVPNLPGPIPPEVVSGELDCAGEPDPGNPDGWIGGLRYCTRGGTGRLNGNPYPGPAGGPFDPDGDGLGALVSVPGQQSWAHGATTADIKTGDWLFERGYDASGAELVEVAGMLKYIFATVPALVSYHDTAGNSMTLTYPYPPGFAQQLPVAAGADGNVVVTLTFWRPQRRPISGEKCPSPTDPNRLCSPTDWIDSGGLHYSVVEPCPQSAFSEDDPTSPAIEDDPSLLPSLPKGFDDTAPDRPASPTNTFTYTLNLTQCSASAWNSGEIRMFEFFAHAPVIGAEGGGLASQHVSFELQ